MSLPELPAPDRTMWQHGQQIDHYTADQMRAYALQAVEALRREPMSRGDLMALMRESGYAHVTAQEKADFITGFRHAEAHHHITQKEQG